MPSRLLTEAETAEAIDIFGESIDVTRVRITRDDPMSFGAPKVIGNTVHLRTDWGLFVDNGPRLSDRGRSVLVHELVHVWQFQNGGLAYIPASLWAQHVAFLRTGSRSGAYRWQKAWKAGLPWARWNPEQQAQAIQDWRDARLRILQGIAEEHDGARVRRLEGLLDDLRAGRGAPRLPGRR